MIARAAAPPARGVLAALLRALIALVLLATGIAKLLDMPGFQAVVATYEAVPVALLAPAAWAVALGELGLATWLASGRALPRAALASAALHGLYLGWAATALVRGLTIANCGCFGVFWARPLSVVTLLEDAALIALSLLLARMAVRA